MKLTDLRVNHVEEPLGFQLKPVSFSWVVTEPGTAKKQKAVRIRVFENKETIFDSGYDEKADNRDYPAELSLKPKTRYTWSVEVMADNGETAEAESWFETGKMEEPWTGKWITPELDPAIQPILRKKFTVDGASEASRLYICGLGVYEAYLNGEKIGSEYLAPGYHSYDFHLQVQTYDVTGLLKEGENTLEVWLGDGWFRGRFGFGEGFRNIYGDKIYLIAELYHGKELAAATDSTWESHPSPIVKSSIYDGETYDARLEAELETGWKGVREEIPKDCGSLAVKDLPKEQQIAEEQPLLNDRYSLPVVKKEGFCPIEVIRTPKNETILDFGQNLTGWVEFDSALAEGEEIILSAAEILQDGCFYRENYRSAVAEYHFISDGKKRHVRPHFTFYGFRYMKVEYVDKSGKPTEKPEGSVDNFTAHHLRSDFDQTGYIETGVKKVNQLFQNALWGQKDNFLDVPTDCPQRDERLGWTGDAQIFSETACYNMYVPAFYRKYLWDMRAEQSIIGGSVPHVVPRLKRELIEGHGSCAWADVAVVLTWNVYVHYGDKTLLEECYPGMKAWVNCMREKEEALGGAHLIKDGFHFADWLALDNPEPGPFGATDNLYIASAYYYWCAKHVSLAAGVLGKTAEETEYAKLAEAVLQAVREKYFDENGLCNCGTQTGSALAIMFGLNPSTETRQAEGNLLAKRIAENNGHLSTGFVGTPMLCPALTETGHDKTAMDLLLNEEYPGWLYCVNMGATTVWERWNSVKPDGHMNPEGMNSLNHYSYGSIEAWMYKKVCGLTATEPGFKKAVIEPHTDPRLGSVSCEVETAAGVYKTGWKYEENGKVSFCAEIPFDAEAEIRLPGREPKIVGAGSYNMEFTPERR